MKKVNWNVIPQQALTKNCFWTKNKNEELPSEDLFVGLAENFSVKPAKKVKIFCAAKPIISLRVIDTNSAQALLILLRVQYKKTSHLIKEYILHCDHSNLNIDFINGLIKCLPKPYQIKQLRKLKMDNVELADAEEFLANLCDIDRLVQRLECIKFRTRFNDMVKNIKPDIEVGTAACKEIVKSEKMDKVLRLILSVGNLMNGTNNGQTTGFEFPILAKLHEIKSADSKKTLLQFLVETIDKNYPGLLNFGDEIINVSGAASIRVGFIQETIEEIGASSKVLKEELECDGVIRQSGDKFVEAMTPFSLHCHDQLQLLTQMMGQMLNEYKKVGKYFAFNVDKYPMEKCFSDMKIFSNSFTQTHAKVVKMHEENRTAGQENQEASARTFTHPSDSKVQPQDMQQQDTTLLNRGMAFNNERVSF